MKEPEVIRVAGTGFGKSKVFVDRSCDQVWLSMSHPCGSTGFFLSVEEAQEVIKALEKALKEALESQV